MEHASVAVITAHHCSIGCEQRLMTIIPHIYNWRLRPSVGRSQYSDSCVTHQGTEEVDSFQDELLMSYSRDTQLLQLLMGDVQQLLSSHLLPLETLHILLETVIQTCGGERHTEFNMSDVSLLLSFSWVLVLVSEMWTV